MQYNSLYPYIDSASKIQLWLLINDILNSFHILIESNKYFRKANADNLEIVQIARLKSQSSKYESITLWAQ